MLDARHGEGLCGDRVDRTLDDAEVVMGKQVVVGSSLAVVREWFDVGENVKDARRRRRSIVEQEHDPNVDSTKNSELSSHNNGRLLIGIIIREVAHSCKELIGLIRGEEKVSSPYLGKVSRSKLFEECITNLANRVCDHVVGSNNTIVVTSTLESFV
jgi:hypothetical protein